MQACAPILLAHLLGSYHLDSAISNHLRGPVFPLYRNLEDTIENFELSPNEHLGPFQGGEHSWSVQNGFH